MNGVEQALFGRIGAVGPLSEGEYLGSDGLRYCRNCNTPTQCRVVRSESYRVSAHAAKRKKTLRGRWKPSVTGCMRSAV